MIKFNCIVCKEELEAPLSLIGQLLNCPKCGELNKVVEPKHNKIVVENKEHKIKYLNQKYLINLYLKYLINLNLKYLINPNVEYMINLNLNPMYLLKLLILKPK